MVQDASAYVGRIHGHTAHQGRGAEWIHQMLRTASHAQMDADTNPDPATAIQAYVNHGRWIAECPDCRNAQLACKTDPRFLCNECGNVAVGKLWRQVVFPPNVNGIENQLTNRPLENQNWSPGESRMSLAVDNLVNMGRIK